MRHLSDQLTPEGVLLTVAALAKVDRCHQQILRLMEDLMIVNLMHAMEPAEFAVVVSA
jgi:hypothetical protein